LTHRAFDRAIERTLLGVHCVVAVWSKHSVDSDWVRAEAAWAKANDKLVSIGMEGQLSLPIQFYHVHTQRMADWDGSRETPVFHKLVEDIRAVAGAPKTVTDDTAERASELARGRTILPSVRPREPLSSFRDPRRDGGEGPEMVVIPTGSFWMGSPEDEPDRFECEGPRHRVEISRAFALGRTAVTFEEYDRFVEATGRNRPSDNDWGSGSRPVIDVSWDDVLAYAAWLCEQASRCYRLPTEAEWEYAARAGTETPYSTGACIHTDQANYNGNDDYNECGSKTGVFRGKTVPTGSLPPSPWGLHEMHGNVWEWVQDCWHEGYSGAPTNVCAARDTRLFAAVPLQNENHSTLNGSFRAAAPAHGAMPAQA